MANLLGGAWITLLTVAITPLQINILGMEAFGVVGFITTLQIAFTAFDFGLSSTLTRELAADHSLDKRNSVGLLRTSSTVYWFFAAAIGMGLFALSRQIAHRWFNSNDIDISVLEQSLRVIALYLALRWPVALYSGVLAGLQRMDVLNMVKVAVASARLLGGIAVLLKWPSLYVFLLWTSFSALIEVMAYWIACRGVYSLMPARPGISWSDLQRVWRFSVSMNALAILAVLIVQLDRLLISKMLPLDDLGYYSLAYSVAAGVAVIIAAVSSAMMPSFAAAYGAAALEVLRTRYDSANRAMLFSVGLAAFALVFFGYPILSIWVGPSAAAGTAPSLALLAAGFWCSAVIANVYNVAVASGNPSKHLRVNLLTSVPYAFGLYWMIERFGIEGAGASWLLLNLAYAVLLVPTIHRNILGFGVSGWIIDTVIPFMLLGVISFGLPYIFLGVWKQHASDFVAILALACSVVLYCFAGYYLLGNRIRQDILAILGRMGRV